MSAPSKLWWIVLAWPVFAGGLFALGVVDRGLRMRDGEVHHGGVGPSQSPMVICLGVAASWLVWHGTVGIRPAWRVVVLVVHAALGLVLYAAAAIAYVCGTGIDCF